VGGNCGEVFLSHPTNARLQPRLLRELKPGARVVCHGCGMPIAWKPDRDISVQGTHVFLWTTR